VREATGIEIRSVCAVLLAAAVVLIAAGAYCGNLEIHCVNVGQGDCTVIISPTGGSIMFDGGKNGTGYSTVIPYIHSLGLYGLDYIIASHYHEDHIGGIDEVVSSLGIDSVRVAVLDRGWSYTTPTYTSYAAAVASKRATIFDGQVIDLGGGVTVTCVAVNGNGILTPPFDTSYDENDYSVALLVEYLDFDFFVAGDLSGVNSSSYNDIETSVGNEVGNVDVYRVDHHGSISNSNANLVSSLLPTVSIISVGDNPYGHPMQTILNRLVFYGSYIYQTGLGTGGTIPAGNGEVVNDHVVIEVDSTFYVINTTDVYDMGAESIPIADVNADDATGRPLLYGQAVFVEGIVTVGTGTFSTVDNDIFVQDVTGGVNVVDRNTQAPAVSVGDRLSLSGIVDQSKGLTKLSSPQITVVATDVGEPEPVSLTTAMIDSAGETYEGLFVKVEICSISAGTWPDEGFDGTLTIDDGSGGCTLFIDSDTDIDGSPEPTGEIEIVGIVTQYDTSSPYNCCYRLMPRSTSDISLPYSGVGPVAGQPEIMRVLPNPARGNLRLVFGNHVAGLAKEIAFYDVTGRKVAECRCAAGQEALDWDAANPDGVKLPGGIYFAEMIAGRNRHTEKIVLLK